MPLAAVPRPPPHQWQLAALLAAPLLAALVLAALLLSSILRLLQLPVELP